MASTAVNAEPASNTDNQQKTGFLPTLPNITTTISQLLSSPVEQQTDDRSKASAAADRTMASPLSAYLPSVPWWGRRSSVRSSSKSAGNSPRSVKSDMALQSLDEVAKDSNSQHSSDGDSHTTKKRKRSPKPKTCYSLCHAPPKAGTRSKIQVRARPLLQLHKHQDGSRPRPEYELLPSAIFSARLMKAIAKFSGSKHGLSPHDMAIVKAEKYHLHEDAQDEVDESTDILAVLCGIGRSSNTSLNVRIIMEGGQEWEAYQTPAGNYECTTTDEHGLKKTIRWWLPKRCKTGDVTSSMSPISPTFDTAAASPERTFKFSTVSTSTRRHPVMAYLTKTGLEILDTYSIPAPMGSVDLAAPKLDRTQSDNSVESATDNITTSDELRAVITATSIYVALAEGWCARFRSDDSLVRSSSTRSTSKSVSPSKANRNSTPAAVSGRRPPSIDLEPIKRTSSLRQVLRNPTGTFGRKLGMDKDGNRPLSTSSSIYNNDPAPSAAMPGIPEADTPVPSRRRRANTTSTVIVRPDASSSSPRWGPGYEDETDDDEEHRPEDELDRKITEEEEDEEVQGATTAQRPQSSHTLNDGTASDTSSAKRRNLSGSTYGSFETKSDAATAPVETAKKERAPVFDEKKTSTIVRKKNEAPRKKGLMSRLLCGMV